MTPSSGGSKSNELEPAPKINVGGAGADMVCTISVIVVLADVSGVREVGGDAGAMEARPDASAIAQCTTVLIGRDGDTLFM